MENSPIKILHVVDTLGLGGAERFLVGLVTHLDRERFHPMVAWLTASGPFEEQLREQRIPVVGINARGHRDFKAWQRLVEVMRGEQVHIVHTHLFVDGFYGRLAAMWSKVPVRIVTQQNAYDDPARRLPRWQIWTNRLLVPTTQHFVAVSRAAAEYLHKVEWVPWRKISLIPNAIEPPAPVPPERVQALRREWLGPDGSGPLLGTVARLEPQKGLDVLIRAVAVLSPLMPGMRCIMVGRGGLEEELRTLARSLGVEGQVLFLGPRSDIPAILAALDIFVLPSRFEGLSLALLEAMAAGKPVVATAVSGTVEVIQDGETGVLVPPEDEVSLARALLDLISQPRRARTLGERARTHVLQHYTIDKIAEQYMELYSRVGNENNHVGASSPVVLRYRAGKRGEDTS